MKERLDRQDRKSRERQIQRKRAAAAARQRPRRRRTGTITDAPRRPFTPRVENRSGPEKPRGGPRNNVFSAASNPISSPLETHRANQADIQAHAAAPAYADENPTPDEGNEAAGLCAYYAGLMAAVRSTLSRRHAAAVIRNLKSEKIIAFRNAKNRRHAQRIQLRVHKLVRFNQERLMR